MRLCFSDILLLSRVQVSVLLMRLLFVCAAPDPQNGHVLRPDGQPPAQRLQTDAVCQPAGALCRSILVHLHQPAVLPHQLPLHGSPSPGQSSPSATLLHRKTNLFMAAFPHLTLPHELFQMPHEVASQSSADLSVTNNTVTMKRN